MMVTAPSPLRISVIWSHYRHGSTMLSSSHQVIFWLYSNAEGVCIVYPPLPWVIYKLHKRPDTLFIVNPSVLIYNKKYS